MRPSRVWVAVWSLAGALTAGSACAAPTPDDATPGANVESLLAIARERNPEFASARHEAQAAVERIGPAGALPDPKFRVELMDITKMGAQNPSVLPSNVGSTRYTFTQDVPLFGKPELRRNIAAQDAGAAQARWVANGVELSARIKTAFAQLYQAHQSERLTREILDLMRRLEQVAQARYAGGQTAQQDVIRAQVEQSNLENELIALDNEQRMLKARLNTWMARPVDAPVAWPQQLRAIPSPQLLNMGALQERLRVSSPQLLAQDAQVRSSQAARELTVKNRYPDLTVGVTPAQYGRAIREWSLMVEVNIPWQQDNRRAQEREAQAMVDAAQSRREALANDLVSALAQDLLALEAAQRTEQTTRTRLLPQAELTSRSALASYESGRVDFSTLLDAQRQIRLARQTQIKAQVDAQLRLADIERLLGEDL